MRSKTDEFKYWSQRQGRKKPKQAPRPRRDRPVDTSLPGVSATDRHVGHGSLAHLHPSKGKKAVYALEDVGPGQQPSRKSTRGSAHRLKPSSPRWPAGRGVMRRGEHAAFVAAS